jgi:hypothetical protein
VTATDRPRTRYPRSGDVAIAYQSIGNGPIDLVFTPGFVLKGLTEPWRLYAVSSA